MTASSDNEFGQRTIGSILKLPLRATTIAQKNGDNLPLSSPEWQVCHHKGNFDPVWRSSLLQGVKGHWAGWLRAVERWARRAGAANGEGGMGEGSGEGGTSGGLCGNLNATARHFSWRSSWCLRGFGVAILVGFRGCQSWRFSWGNDHVLQFCPSGRDNRKSRGRVTGRVIHPDKQNKVLELKSTKTKFSGAKAPRPRPLHHSQRKAHRSAPILSPTMSISPPRHRH